MPLELGLAIWVTVFPAICVLLALHWRLGVWLGLLTGALWGPFGPVALWSAKQPRMDPCEECGHLLAEQEMTCPACGAEYYDDGA